MSVYVLCTTILLTTAFCYGVLILCRLSAAINKAAEAWGVDCKRYEIRELTRLN